MTRALIPNSTQIPDVILDFWLSELSGAELKVVLYVGRRTFGFGKQSDNISLSQISTGIVKRDGTVLDTGTGLSRSSVARAIKTLEAKQIILRKLNLNEKSNEHEESTYRLNLAWRVKGSSGGGGRVVPDSDHVPSNGDARWSHDRTTSSPKIEPGVVPESNPQETAQEAEQETAAVPSVPCTDAAELVHELIAHDMNRGDAIRLATADAAQCRRQLDFLRFRMRVGFVFKSGRGAFLRRAIEDGFAPPRGYEEARRAEVRSMARKAHRSAEIALRASKRSSLKQTLARLEIDQPDEFAAFLAYVERKKREAVDRPIVKGAPEVGERLIRSFETEGTRLALLAEFLTDQSLSYGTQRMPRSFDGSTRIVGSTSSRKPS
ncbi:MAG: replication protein [Armatimonadetes bacterium]|nr:replication protein [Armatimonadota bacterium]MDE2205489.1 replication protein [Armatimonadota bacterium]